MYFTPSEGEDALSLYLNGDGDGIIDMRQEPDAAVADRLTFPSGYDFAPLIVAISQVIKGSIASFEFCTDDIADEITFRAMVGVDDEADPLYTARLPSGSMIHATARTWLRSLQMCGGLGEVYQCAAEVYAEPGDLGGMLAALGFDGIEARQVAADALAANGEPTDPESERAYEAEDAEADEYGGA